MYRLFFYIIILFSITACGAKKGAQSSPDAGLVSDGDVAKFQTAYFEAQKEKAIENYSKAYQKFQECSQLNPKEDAVFYELARLDTLNANFSSGLSNVNTAISLAPNNLWYTRLKADVEVELGKLDDALNTLKTIQKRAPEDVLYADKLASLAAYSGDYKTALAAYNSIEKEVGSNADLTRQKYYLFIDQGKKEDALAELQKLSDKFPTNAEYLRNIGSHHMESEDANSALSVYDRIVDLNPNDGNSHLALAEIYSSLGRSAESNESLALGFSSPQAPLETKIKLLFAIIESKDASVDLESLISQLQETHPDRGETWSISGDWAEMNNQSSQALEAYKKALDIDPNYKVLWEKVNQMAFLAKNHNELLDLSSQAMSLYPLESGFYYFNGIAHLELGNQKKGINALTTGVDFTLDDVATTMKFQIALGKAHFDEGKYDLAQNWLEKSMSLGGSSNGEALEYLGDCLFKLGETAEAVAKWKQAKSYSGVSELIDRKIADEQYIAE